MSNRDTQFKGFAKLLYEELRTRAIDEAMANNPVESWDQIVVDIIARRAYDLLLHAAHSTALLDTWEESKVKVALVPDMTTWNEVPEERQS